MPISIGENIIANDFINESEIPTPQSDAEGKVVKLEEDGKISSKFLKTNSTVLKYENSVLGSISTLYDVTNPTGNTFRYTYGSGDNPNITSSSVPVGCFVSVTNTSSFSAGNIGTFAVTNSGTNWFEVNNPSGVVETSKRSAIYVQLVKTWTKQPNLKYIQVKMSGGGAGGRYSSTGTSTADGGGGGAYLEKTFSESELSATETVIVGYRGEGGKSATGTTQGSNGGNSIFKSLIAGGGLNNKTEGVATGGDLNINGGTGGSGSGGGSGTTPVNYEGGSSHLGNLQRGTGSSPVGFGAGGNGGRSSGGGTGCFGVVIITEYYS